MEQQLAYCKSIECDTARAAYCKSLGFNKERLEFAFHPSNFPHVDPATGLPQDAMHLFPDGILRSEGAWLVYVMAKLGLKVASINEAMSRYTGWPPDVRVPPLSNKLTSGKEGGVPDSNTTLKMSGSQVMHFTLHSVAILEPLLTQEMKEHPAWLSWVALCALFSKVCKHELKVSEIEAIDDLQLQHSAAFDAVPEYNGLKRPKHHFAAHLAGDIWRYGPPRGYWCFGFEAFNKVMKSGAQLSNWKCPALAVMQYWSKYSARVLDKL